MERLRDISLDAYDRLVGLELGDVTVDGCASPRPLAEARKPGKALWTGAKEASNAPRRWTLRASLWAPLPPRPTATTNRHDLPLLGGTLDAVAEALGGLPDRASIHLDRGYDSGITRERLQERGLVAEISEKGKPAPLSAATKRWVIERTNSWHNAHKKLVWCTERSGPVIDFWVAFSDVVIIVRRLIREGWRRYRWEGRPSRCP
jgi:hypothetical protein